MLEKLLEKMLTKINNNNFRALLFNHDTLFFETHVLRLNHP